MGKTLILTEKPSVAMEYAKVLGVNGRSDGYCYNDQYVITWCVGHLVQMSMPEKYDKKYEKWNLADLPFIPEEYRFEIIRDVEKQFRVVKRQLNSPDVSMILYAGDSGREGEVIGRWVREQAGVRDGVAEKRVWIDSFTKDEILRGIRDAKPLAKYDSLYQAGLARAIEDYVTGLNFSRALSCVFGARYNSRLQTKRWMTLAVGRVMTCVMGLVVAREREIRSFKVTDFYRIRAEVCGAVLDWKVNEKSRVYNNPVLYNEKGFKKESDAAAFAHWITPSVRVTELKTTEERKKPPYLYNLAELQGDCAKLFKISPDETLAIAQTLYEKKLTTYPRTDARVLSSAVAAEICKNLRGLAGYGGEIGKAAAEILAEDRFKGLSRTMYVDDSKITDHYAVIPTGDISARNDITEAQLRVYELICRRFLSIFYPPAVYKKTELTCTAYKGPYEETFVGSAKNLSSPGYYQIAGIPKRNAEENELSSHTLLSFFKGNEYPASYNTVKGQTQPPKRYTSGTMILAMENAGTLIEDEELRAQIKNCGIGTAATRAEVISKLIRRQYIKLDKKTQNLSPTQGGEMLYDIVAESLVELLSPKMTASWERGLEQIRAKDITMQQYLTTVYDFVRIGVGVLRAKKGESSSVEMQEKQDGDEKRAVLAETEVPCPLCGRKLNPMGYGYGCSGWNHGRGCKFSIGKVFGRICSREELEKLIVARRSDLFDDFFSKKTGKTYSAYAVLKDDGTLALEFPSMA